jgi:hypothetical protein
MATTERRRLLELRGRLRAVLQSEEAQAAPASVRRQLWLAAIRIHQLRGKRVTPIEVGDAIRFVGQTIDEWTAWLGESRTAESSR